MTNLQHIEIEGFKGIERLEFEPSGINLVTGRNNTGKTSLLEAIALVFDPHYIEEFGEDIDSLIHEDFEECRVVVETSEGTREVSFRHPTEEEARQYFTSSITSYATENLFFEMTIEGERTDWLSPHDEHEANNYLKERIVEAVQSSVIEYLNGSLSNGLQEECIVLSTNGENYPYVMFGPRAAELIEESTEVLLEESAEGPEEDGQPIEIHRIAWPGDSFQPSSGRSSPTKIGFLNEPPKYDGIPFVKSKNLLSAPDFDPDSEDAIKRDDLGDYIKETGLVDELKTFNLDTLVFEKEDGEKYSVPYDFMGDGFKTVVGLLWELMDDEVEDQIVLLEEPENHMHPGYVLNVVHFLVELAREEDVQLFVTTHNKDFIDAFFNENRTGEQEEFLKDEFTLLQMQGDSALVEDYETAREDLEDLHLDLRGI